METKFVAPENLSGKLGDKKHLYEILTVDGKFIKD